MSKVSCLLDAGHGGTDTGAQAAGINESDVVLAIVLAIGARLEHLTPNIDISYTRIKDQKKSLHTRFQSIIDIKPNAFVSVHCNAIADDSGTPYDDRKYAEGYEIFYRDEHDLPLALAVNRVMGRAYSIWRHMRGIKQDQRALGKKLKVLNSLAVPCILVEVGFISNTLECKMIVENTGAIADLIAHGIYDFLFSEQEAGA